MDIPTFREIVADLERRGFGRVRCKGSHATYARGGRTVTVCVKRTGGHPRKDTYKLICKRLWFEPGKDVK